MELVFLLMCTLIFVAVVIGIINVLTKPGGEWDEDLLTDDHSDSLSTAGTTTPTRSTSAVTPAPGRTAPPPRPTDTELLSGLPATYYVLAILCGIVLLIFTLANADKFSSFQIGSLIGYTVGGVLSMLAVGRVIELLQQIRDAVRNTPTLSPGRSDDE